MNEREILQPRQKNILLLSIIKITKFIKSLNLNNTNPPMKKQMTLIYYYVPEDKDDPQVPNVFGVSIKKDQIRLKHLQQNFPIAGEYIFRFKVLYENHIAWLDLPDLNAKLPTFKDKIMVKASRVSWDSKRPPAQHQNKAVNSLNHSQSVSEHKFASLDTRPQPKIEKSPPRPEVKKNTESFNLIDDMHSHSNHQGQSTNPQDDSLL